MSYIVIDGVVYDAVTAIILGVITEEQAILLFGDDQGDAAEEEGEEKDAE